ncbi:hypothetical protein LCGC14_1929040 [marine sediment metagenome]|uniref:Uncharacterized protein n=1 Tax=marine sediment metagenome TaxID=412755 RepID=A0A0F9GBZ2_9ZZZZ|nr:MAG: hypothetical protein Lokiarch_51480 [Candidatus Lokiarchaeum sp. GC14_75]
MANFDNDVSHRINVAAYYLSQKNFAYDKLCWLLAERQLLVQRDPKHNQHGRMKEKAAEIFFSGPPYDILVYLIAELDILIKLKKT